MFSFDALGRHFEFFSYIFNVADSAITIGALLLIFRRKSIS
jgi:signal peptidase II